MRNKKNMVIGLLCVALVFMGIGYSIFNATLNISGTARASGSFDVEITSVTMKSKSSGVTDTMASPGYSAHEANLSATFNEPGEYITYTIEVSNLGSIDAVINAAVNGTGANDEYFDMTCDLTQPRDLLVNGVTEFDCTITYDEDFEVTASTIPSTIASMTVTVEAEQKTTSTPPTAVCYTPLSETKTLGVINGSAKTDISTYGVENIQVGDLLGYGTSEIESNEQFYVLENNNGTLKLLSRYLINVSYIDSNNKNHQKPWDNCSRDTRGLQDKTLSLTRSNVNVALTEEEMGALEGEFNARGYLYGSLVFSSTNYWYDNTNNQYVSPFSVHSFVYNSSSTLKTYVDSYVSTLNTLGFNATNGTILSIQDLGGICNNTDFTQSNDDTSGCPSYVFETSYWLGSARDKRRVWFVDAYGNVDHRRFDDGDEIGVRPVITVSLS